jgi:hypothetical protein
MKKIVSLIALIYCVHCLSAQTRDTVYITKDEALKFRVVEDAFPVPKGYTVTYRVISFPGWAMGDIKDMSDPGIANAIKKSKPGNHMVIGYIMPSKSRKGATVEIERCFIFK